MTLPPAARALEVLALATALVAGGCGEDGRGGRRVPLVEIVANRLDGEPPTRGLAIRRVDTQAHGEEVTLTPAPGRPNVYEARGASEGLYLPVLPDGWGPLFVVAPPRVVADGHPAKMNVGRAHTMYLASRSASRLLGKEWGARKVRPDGSLGPPLPLQVEQDGNGWVLLRFRREDWAGATVVQGRFEDGGLTETIDTTLLEAGLPLLRQLDGAPAGPLRVAVVGAPPGAERWVHVRALGLPIEDPQRRPVRDGVAEFAQVAVAKGGVEVRVGDDADAPTYRVPPEVWARDGEVRVRDAMPAPRAAVRLTLPGASALVRVQARAEDEDAYGWVPAEGEGDSVRLVAGPGAWRVLAQTRAGFASGDVRVGTDGTLASATLGAVEPAARVIGRVAGDLRDARLVWRRVEGDRAVLAHGFVVGLGQAGAFEVSLPPGEYRLEFHGAEGPRGTAQTHVLEPGGHLALLSLEMPLPRPR